MDNKEKMKNDNIFITVASMDAGQVYHPPVLTVMDPSDTGTGGVNVPESDTGQLENSS